MRRVAGGQIKHVSGASAKSLSYCDKCKCYFDGDLCPQCGKRKKGQGNEQTNNSETNSKPS